MAKDIYEKRNYQKIQHKNPNTEKFAMESSKKPKIVRQSDLKLINNDRMIPPKSIKKYIVSRKTGQINAENRLYLILGICQLLLSRSVINFLLLIVFIFLGMKIAWKF